MILQARIYWKSLLWPGMENFVLKKKSLQTTTQSWRMGMEVGMAVIEFK